MTTAAPLLRLDLKMDNKSDTTTTTTTNTTMETPKKENVTDSNGSIGNYDDLIADGKGFLMIFGSIFLLLVIAVLCSKLYRKHRSKRHTHQRQNSTAGADIENQHHNESAPTVLQRDSEIYLNLETKGSSSKRVSEFPDTPDFEFISAPMTRPRQTKPSTTEEPISDTSKNECENPVSYENCGRRVSSGSIYSTIHVSSQSNTSGETEITSHAQVERSVVQSPSVRCSNCDSEMTDRSSQRSDHYDNVDQYASEFERDLDGVDGVNAIADDNLVNDAKNGLPICADAKAGIYVHDAKLALINDSTVNRLASPPAVKLGLYIRGAREVGESEETNTNHSRYQNKEINTYSDNHRDTYFYCDVQPGRDKSKSEQACVSPGLYVHDDAQIVDNESPIYDNNDGRYSHATEPFKTLPFQTQAHVDKSKRLNSTGELIDNIHPKQYSKLSNTLPNNHGSHARHEMIYGVYVTDPQTVEDTDALPVADNPKQDNSLHHHGIYVQNPQTADYKPTTDDSDAPKGIYVYNPQTAKYLTDTIVPSPKTHSDRAQQRESSHYDYCDSRDMEDWLQTPVSTGKYVRGVQLAASDCNDNTVSHIGPLHGLGLGTNCAQSDKERIYFLDSHE